MSLMKNNTNKILAFLMALLMIIQLMPFTSLAENDPDGVETSEILETITEDDFEDEIEDEPEEEDPEEDEDLPEEAEENFHPERERFLERTEIQQQKGYRHPGSHAGHL